MSNDDLMNWIATGNQVATDWYTLIRNDGTVQPNAPRYVPPNLAPGYTLGTSLQQSPLIIVGIIVVVAIVLMK